MIDLGEAEEIEVLTRSYLLAISRPPDQCRRDLVLHAVTDEVPVEPSRGPTHPAHLQIGRVLRERLIDPVEQAVGGLDRVWLAPDGELSRLPFETLPSARERLLLLETHRVSYLATGRDVLRLGEPDPSGDALVPTGQPKSTCSLLVDLSRPRRQLGWCKVFLDISPMGGLHPSRLRPWSRGRRGGPCRDRPGPEIRPLEIRAERPQRPVSPSPASR
jgi:CHAT domain